MQLFAFSYHKEISPWATAPAWAIEIRKMLGLILNEENMIMDTLDDLASDVASEDTVIASAIALLNGIDARIAAAGADPAKLAALRSDVQSNKAALAAAVLANTPTAPAGAAPVAAADATAAADAAVATG